MRIVGGLLLSVVFALGGALTVYGGAALDTLGFATASRASEEVGQRLERRFAAVAVVHREPELEGQTINATSGQSGSDALEQPKTRSEKLAAALASTQTMLTDARAALQKARVETRKAQAAAEEASLRVVTERDQRRRDTRQAVAETQRMCNGRINSLRAEISRLKAEISSSSSIASAAKQRCSQTQVEPSPVNVENFMADDPSEAFSDWRLD